MNFNDLTKYTKEDKEKRKLIDDILCVNHSFKISSMKLMSKGVEYSDIAFDSVQVTKYCPKCGREYPEDENFCFECLIALKEIKSVDVRDIKIKPVFDITKTNNYDSFEDIFSGENLEKITKFDFKVRDLKEIINSIKRTAFRRLDGAIKENDINLKYLSVLDKVTLFSKAFVELEYKSYGEELGYYEFGKIYVDDRQSDALQITTILHELTHFLIKEITSHILCHILDCSKTTQIESLSVFILSYSALNRLMDEYAAHTVEGRFTLFGYQDYSSYLSIEKTIDLEPDEIEMLKTIGNSFANYIKEILESFIDRDMLEDIKEQFRRDVMDSPDYRNLSFENCTLLNNRGMVQALKMIIVDGFAISMDNIDTLMEYDSQW